MKSHANLKHSYIVMKLDHQLDKFRDYGYIDLEELHDYIALFRQLPNSKQRKYAWMLDDAAELWDMAEQPTE